MITTRTKCLNSTMFQDLRAAPGLVTRFQGCFWPFNILFAGFIALGFALATQAQPVITPQPGYTILWDGNDGVFFGSTTPDNVALARHGGQAFGSGQLFPEGVGQAIDNVIDGFSDNAHSWISGSEMVPTNVDLSAGPFIGVRFTSTIAISSIAWGRDNSIAAQVNGYPDRWQTVYTLQVTTVANPDAGTIETGDPATGWVTLGTVTTGNAQASATFRPWMRHKYDVAQRGNPIQATGLRIKVAWAATDICEIEVNPIPFLPLVITSSAPYIIHWDGNDGQFTGLNVPDNVALATNGGQAFGSGQLFPEGVGQAIDNVIDGFYGNNHSWISGFEEVPANVDVSAGPFVGVRFTNTIAMRSIAWGRHNAGDPVVTDRWAGTYTLQVTSVGNPDAGTTETGDPATGWVTLGTVKYEGQSSAFRPWVRHRYDVTQGGNPIQATGLRIKVSDGSTDIDEIEVNAPVPVQPATLSITRQANAVVISWTSTGTLQVADEVTGPYIDVVGATNPMTFSTTTDNRKYFRVRQ
jgi:hypothetical protein